MRVNTIGRVLIGTVGAAVIFTGLALATPGSGTVSTLIGPPVTYEGFKVMRDADDWKLKIDAKDGLTVATQTITFQPGGQSGWHRHPGPVFISVKEGTMTFYDANCNATVMSAGQGFLDVGDDEHLARNESGSPATNVVTYFAPPHTTILRIDAPQPSTCRM